MIIREGSEVGELKVDDPAAAARAVETALTPFFHPILIQDRIQRGEDTDADLREQIRLLGKLSASRPHEPTNVRSGSRREERAPAKTGKE